MSSDNIVLSAKNISKRFDIYNKPRHRLQQMFLGRFGKQYFKEFWAFHDISFDICKGECVGVIGKNGAGKSTLLQILVGTLQPTIGKVSLTGRVAALLELGSGFDPEFTGRENVYMNAAILGLSKSETNERFQEILDFAGIGDFIDQPVKNYSSGMMVRLAFSVQIMVDPDILIVDEALAVGDAAFQRKCFARMEQLMKKGTTLFLVTHDTETVKRLCTRVLFLKDKICVFDGPASEGVALYMKYLFPSERLIKNNENLSSKLEDDSIIIEGSLKEDELKKVSLEEEFCYTWTPEQKELKNSYGYGGGQICMIRIYGLTEPNLLPETGQVRIEIEAKWDQDILYDLIETKGIDKNVFIGFGISNEKNIRIFGDNTYLNNIIIDPLKQKEAIASFCIDFPRLKAGQYFLVAALSLGRMGSELQLDWNDYTICLVSNNDVSGGFIAPDTKVSIKNL